MPARKSAACESIRHSHYKMKTEYTCLPVAALFMRHTQIFSLSLPAAALFLLPHRQ
ncbi:hypothetical protein [Azospirillum endophyticum]